MSQQSRRRPYVCK